MGIELYEEWNGVNSCAFTYEDGTRTQFRPLGSKRWKTKQVTIELVPAEVIVKILARVGVFGHGSVVLRSAGIRNRNVFHSGSGTR